MNGPYCRQRTGSNDRVILSRGPFEPYGRCLLVLVFLPSKRTKGQREAATVNIAQPGPPPADVPITGAGSRAGAIGTVLTLNGSYFENKGLAPVIGS
jgi:hypothetical protein